MNAKVIAADECEKVIPVFVGGGGTGECRLTGSELRCCSEGNIMKNARDTASRAGLCAG